MEKFEYRLQSFDSVETREEGDKRTIAGHAAVFNVETRLGRYVREKISPGAFKNTLTGDVRALWSHNIDLVLGRTKSGTLRLREDEVGLHFELDLPNTTLGRDSYETIKRGDVSGTSFGFKVKKETWQETEEEDVALRIIQEVELFEISPTAFPAYPETDVSARSVCEIEERGRVFVEERRKVKTFSLALATKKLDLLLVA